MTDPLALEPGVMISQTWPLACDTQGATLRALQHVVDDGFFRAVQTVHVPGSTERRSIDSLVHDAGLRYTYTLSRLQNRNALNLSSVIRNDRMKAVQSVAAMLDDAREAGADRVCVISGPGPMGDQSRRDALESLSESLMHLAENAGVPPGLELLIEPLDFMADKKQTLGTVNEGFELCESVEKVGHRLGLCVDTAHMLLNGERIVGRNIEDQSGIVRVIDSPNPAVRFVREFHFCNAVIDLGHPLFGDRHLRFGAPGDLAVRDLAGLLDAMLLVRGVKTEPVLGVFCEVLNNNPSDAHSATETYTYVRNILKTLAERPAPTESSIESVQERKNQ
jgi:sugar phosphate isomerase/epimerase